MDEDAVNSTHQSATEQGSNAKVSARNLKYTLQKYLHSIFPDKKLQLQQFIDMS